MTMPGFQFECKGCGNEDSIGLTEDVLPCTALMQCEECQSVFQYRFPNDGKQIATDGGLNERRETHVDAVKGLWIPPEFRTDEGQVVIRTPRATIQHWGGLDAYYGMVDGTHFGHPDQWHAPKNPDLAPMAVRIKVEGKDPVEFDISDLGLEPRPDGGQREVYYAAGFSNGTLVWHDDRDCRALQQATRIHSAPLSHIEDRRDQCQYCAGYEPDRTDQDRSAQELLQDADPEIVPDGAAPDPDAFRIPTIDELDAMRTAAGLSQKDLSLRAGHNKGLFNTILRRDMDPQTSTLRSFLEVLREAVPQTDDEIECQGPKPERSSLSRRRGNDDDEERDWTDYEQTATRLERAPPDVVGDGRARSGGDRDA